MKNPFHTGLNLPHCANCKNENGFRSHADVHIQDGQLWQEVLMSQNQGDVYIVPRHTLISFPLLAAVVAAPQPTERVPTSAKAQGASSGHTSSIGECPSISDTLRFHVYTSEVPGLSVPLSEGTDFISNLEPDSLSGCTSKAYCIFNYVI